MKKYIFLVVAFFSTLDLCAADLVATYKTGTITYKLYDNNSAYIYQDSSSVSSLSGTVNIPATVTYTPDGGVATNYTVWGVELWLYKSKVNLDFSATAGMTSFDVTKIRSEIGTLTLSGNVTSITLPATYNDTSGSAKYYNTSDGTRVIGAYVIADANTVFASVDGVLYNKDKTILLHFPCQKENTYYTFPTTITGLTTIGANAFYNNNRLVKITLPSTVTTIGNNAFRECSSMYECDLPNSVTSIGTYAFYSYYSSNSILSKCTVDANNHLPTSLATVGMYAFYNCKLDFANNTITLPASLNNIGEYAFHNAFKNNSATTVEFPASWNGIVRTIGNYAFNCNIIRSYMTQPTTLGNNYPLSNVSVVYVPAEAYDTYKSLLGWSSLYNDNSSYNKLKVSTTMNVDASINLTLTEVLGENKSFAIKLNSTTEGAIIKYVNSKNVSDLAKDPTDWYDYDMTNKPEIGMEDGATLKAIAFSADKTKCSAIQQKTYDKSSTTCNDPVIEAAEGVATLSMAVNDGSTIYYTTDGSNPTISSAKYTAPITLTGNFTYKAIAAQTGKFSSNVITKEVNWFTCADVVYEQVLENGQPKIKMSTTTPDALIYYCVGYRSSSIPTDNNLYPKTPIEYNSGDRVYAIAVKDNYNNSTWKSEYVYYPNTYSQCNTPSLTKDDDTHTVAISSDEEGVTLHYTIDGTTPNNQSTTYTEPINITSACVVKAIAAKEGKVNSSVSTYNTEDWFRLADVIFVPEYNAETSEYTVKLAHEVEGVTMYYSFKGYYDNYTPNFKYDGTAIVVPEDNYIYAMATKEGTPDSKWTNFYASSDNYKVGTPQVTANSSKKTLTVTTSTYGASIYYTTDGTDPTSSSTKLESSELSLSRNATYKFIAIKDKMTNSSITTYKIEWFSCESPEIVTSDDNIVTMRTETEGATIYYSYQAEGNVLSNGELSSTAREYKGPFEREYYGYIYAVTVKDGYTMSSRNSEYSSNSSIRCKLTVESYNGHNLKLATSNGATIYYTVNGNYPYEGEDETSGIMKYNGQSIEINDKMTVRAKAYRTYTYESDILEYTPEFYAGENGAILAEAGSLESAMSWESDPSTITNFKVEGKINGDDLTFIKTKMTGLQWLDMSNTNLTTGIIPDEAFSGLPIISFVSPSGVNQVGEKVFANCPNLASVVWNSSTKLPNSTFDENVNPNLLLFLRYEASAPSNSTARNLIVNGQAASITLVDDDNCNFDCPQEFTAQEISYTHNFKKVSGEGAGWETIVLPFDVQRIFHESKGDLIPFKTYEDQGKPENKKPFWLREFTVNGFVDTTSIRANKPYIICVPNNEKYATRFRLGGKVTFYASNIVVPISDPQSSTRGNVTLTANYIAKPSNGNVLALNVEEYDGHAPGSIFVNENRDIRPFEAYATSVGKSRAYIAVGSLGGDGADTTGIVDVEKILDESDTVKVYNLSGVLIKQGNRNDAMQGLSKGVYIVNGKSLVVK